MKKLVLLILLAATGCTRWRARPALISEIKAADHGLPAERMWGLYELNGSWRWSQRMFGFQLDPPPSDRALYLEMELEVPDEILDNAPALGMIAYVNSVEVGRQVYRRTGRYFFTRYVPQNALGRRPATVVFELDRSAPSSKGEGGRFQTREQGVIFLSAGLKDYEQTAESRETNIWLARQASSQVMQQVAQQLPAAKVVELRRLFFSLPALQHVDFQGIPVDLNPLDLWTMQQVAYEVRPQFVIQTGTGEGGAALYWANILNGTGLAGSKVLGIDAKNRAAKASQQPLWARFVETMEGDPTDTALIARVSQRVQRAATLVVINAGGDVDAVLKEITAYAPLVSRGSYLVVADTAFDTDAADRPRSAGPSEAVRRFLAAGGDQTFEVDGSRDMFVLTSTPGGWLRRK